MCTAQSQNCCVTGDTLILTPKGQRAIGALHREFKPAVPMLVYGIEGGRVIESSMARVWKDPERKRVLEIVTDMGATIRLTDYHSVRVGNEWKRADALVMGDLLAWPLFDRKTRNGYESISLDWLPCVVHRVSALPIRQDVYDLELKSGLSYIANGIVVRAYAIEPVRV